MTTTTIESDEITVLGEKCNVYLSKGNHCWRVKIGWDGGYKVSSVPYPDQIDEAFYGAVDEVKSSIRRQREKEHELEMSKDEFRGIIEDYDDE